MTMFDAPRASGGEENSRPMAGNYVDTHVHIWTDDFEKYPLAQGFNPQEMVPRVFSCDDILHHAKPQGVNRVVLIQMSYYGSDNSYLLEAVRRRPEVFAGIAVVDWNGSDPEAKMLLLAQQGVRGFRIFPQNLPAETCLEGEGLDRMFRFAAKENLVLCLLITPRPSLRWGGAVKISLTRRWSLTIWLVSAWQARLLRMICKRSARWPATQGSK
jgi:predicted TIM-barrel fold metal-dependent hydrolase